MKNVSQTNFVLPDNYGYFYPVHNVMCSYIVDFIKNVRIVVSGMLLVLIKPKGKAMSPVQKQFKMEGLSFLHRFNIRQTIKYGASVYLMAAMISIPSGICSSQHTAHDFTPIKNSMRVPSLIELLDISSAEQAAKDHAAAQLAAAQARAQAIAEARARILLEQPFFHRYVMAACQTHGVDVALVRAIILAESSNNPKAVSNRGAQGLMQLMPRTARWLGVKDSFNPAHNIDGGVRYIRQLLDRFENNVELALAAYNAGSRHVRNYGGVPPFKATRIYIKKVLKYRQHFEELLAVDQFETISS